MAITKRNNVRFALMILAAIWIEILDFHCASQSKRNGYETITTYAHGPYEERLDTLVYPVYNIRPVFKQSSVYAKFKQIAETSSGHMFVIGGIIENGQQRIIVNQLWPQLFFENEFWKWNSGVIRWKAKDHTTYFFIPPSHSDTQREVLNSVFQRTDQRLRIINVQKHIPNYYTATGGSETRLIFTVGPSGFAVDEFYLNYPGQ